MLQVRVENTQTEILKLHIFNTVDALRIKIFQQSVRLNVA